MNITRFISFLNKRDHTNIQSDYYRYVEEWRNWWMGYVPAFHKVRESGMDDKLHERVLYSLRMPKRGCEDWASLLLNDKTTLALADSASADWLCGKDCAQTGGILRDIGFWAGANELVELAFRSGTGAFVMSIEGLAVSDGRAKVSKTARICMDYLPAECILPITVRHRQVIDVAFASEVTVGGQSRIYLQTHRLINKDGIDQYQISNEYFTCADEGSESEAFKPTPLPPGMLARFTTGDATPWFSLLSPNIVKNIPGGPGLGMAVFAEALDCARQCDVAFDNYHRDIYLGGKKVFYNKQLVKPLIDSDGNVHYLAPDDIRQQLFITPDFGGENPDADAAVTEYNPDLRVDANSKAVQDALDYFSFKLGLGTHHYQFNAGTIATATQYTGDRQDMVQHANKHQIKVEAALIGIVRAILWAGRTLLGEAVDPNTAVSVNFDDSYISDSETRRKWDQEDALQGFIPKWRYNAEWRGMSEEEARQAVEEARDGETGTAALSF